ncbi:MULTISPECIES: hypothetical protein [Haloarcula]|jgi:hypothetical protein|uniref:Uncharacterized protein n=1 Tax=Haloarcula marismortui ATCC 33800 TaxID=662476 RepID=A0A8T8KUT7_9EURY|nr:hypothetical protein [Haloarcula sinaiiensis]QUJ74983.1 hypothetical protein KDQ40_22305 [Haloarcula sinaiiensis ATCC 33800]
MEQKIILTDGKGKEQEITEEQHSDWEQLGDPCPECGTTEYRHFTAEGGRYGIKEDAVIRRSDYWGAERSLMTQCLSCELVLYRHPAFDLLYDSPQE